MSKSSYRIAGDLSQVVFKALERTFTLAGAKVRYPSDSEIEIRGEDYRVNIYSMEESGDPDSYLLGGRIESELEALDRDMRELARLIEQTGARYSLEYYVDDDTMRTVVHPAVLPPKDGDFVFELGSEHAPDSPFGLDRMTVREDGSFEYENRRGGWCTRSVRGQLSSALKEALDAELARSGFPSVPEHATPPGAGYLTIKRPAGDETAFMNIYAVGEMPGYDVLVPTLRQWCQALRASPEARQLPDGIEAND